MDLAGILTAVADAPASGPGGRSPADGELRHLLGACPDRMRVLARALLFAARHKRDFGRREQDDVLRQLGDLLPDERNALRAAYAEPQDVREYLAAVPLGLERDVYVVSLLALGRDVPAQAAYLQRLATDLRLTRATCRRLHARHGLAAPGH